MNVKEQFNGHIDQSHFDKWCLQFDEDELSYILKLVSNFEYFGYNRLKAELIKLYDLISNEVDDINKVLFVPVGYAVKSGAVISYFFRKENQFPENQFIPYSEISKIETSKFEAIVFLDDYLGTGHQSINIWDNLKTIRGLNSNKEIKFIFATVVGFTKGIEKVNAETDFLVKTSFTVKIEDLPFHPDSSIFISDSERKKAKTIASKYGNLLYPKHPLGYYENSGLVGFFYSTPNNTLPIFWSTKKNWIPLISRGDDYRDPKYLVGPNIGVPENKTFKGFERTYKDDFLIDDFDLDANITAKLLQELKETKVLLLLIPIVKKLKLSEQFINSWLKIINELKTAVHEKEDQSSAIFIGSKDKLDNLEFYLLSSESTIEDYLDIKTFAEQTNGYGDSLAIDNKGNLKGAFSFNPNENKSIPFIPQQLIPAVNFSKENEGLLTLFEGDNKVSIIWNGQRIITHRKSNWRISPSDFENLIEYLSQEHKIGNNILEKLLTVAVEMAYIGEGGLITIGDHDEILTNSAPLINKKISLGISNVLKLGISQLINIFSQDGASIISNKGQVIQHMTTLRPPSDIDLKLEVGKGTKHQTAHIMSHITNSIVIAISVDSNFTIYSKGQKILRMNG